MGRAKSAEPKHHIQFQTSGFRKKLFRAWCGLEVENVLRQQESHVFFDAPRAPSLGMEHDSITKTSLYITKLGYLAKI
jgi:hypothetical protein